MSANKRVVVLLSEVEYGELKRRAGIASMSAYIKSLVFGDDREREEFDRKRRASVEEKRDLGGYTAGVESVATFAEVKEDTRRRLAAGESPMSIITGDLAPEPKGYVAAAKESLGRDVKDFKCHYMAKPGSKCPACRKVHEE